VSLLLLQGHPTQDDSLIQVDIISYFRGLADDYTGAVINKKAAPDFCAGVYFYTRQKAVYMGKQSGTEPQFPQPQGVGDPVYPDGMKSGIAGKDLQYTPGRRVFLEYCPDIFLHHFTNFHFLKLYPLIYLKHAALDAASSISLPLSPLAPV
jgi:hypothetical protein